MGSKAHVLSKYQVEYGTSLPLDYFEKMLAEIERNPKYEDIVTYVNENNTEHELIREALEELSQDETVTEMLRSFAQNLLDSGDPNHDYVRVEVF